MNNHLQQLFSHAYILGGSPCSGKSTIAEMLSAKYGFQYYKADDHDSEHMQRAAPDRQPVMVKYSKMSWDQIWSQPVEQLLQDEIEYYHERFPFIRDDLSQLNAETPAILEGAAFLPELIKQYPVKHENVIFMLPTVEFQLNHYAHRPWIQSILNECNDRNQAFENWMKRDALFGEQVNRTARDCDFRVIRVDGSISIERQFIFIEAQFMLGDFQN
jgi:adenylate kinase family enzyme